MALVDVLTITGVDGSGSAWSLPLHFPSGILTLENIQSGVNQIAGALDAAIDGRIDAAFVLANMTLPALKSTADGDKERGALFSMAAEGTSYRHGIFIPTWKEAGFTGDAVVDTGVYGTLVSLLLNGYGSPGSLVEPSDRYGNDLLAVVKSRKAFRK